GHVTYGRQIGTYPILVGLPYRTGMDRFVDVRVVSHGQRSLTAVEYPLDVNHAPLAAISALPGIGAKRAARIVRARPFDSPHAFLIGRKLTLFKVDMAREPLDAPRSSRPSESWRSRRNTRSTPPPW